MQEFAYFQRQDSEQFTFFRVPKVLFTHPFFANLSTEAKILYGVMLDRVSLSQKNGWVDEQGNVYIQFTIAEMMNYLNWTKYRITELLKELDSPPEGIGLIERRRMGFTRPNVIYVKNFASVLNRNRGAPEFRNTEIMKSEQSEIMNSDIRKSRSLTDGNHEVCQSDKSNTDSNKTEDNDTDSIKSKLVGNQTYYGTFANVLLSDMELKELKRRFPYDWKYWIERLSSYMASSGKSYKSHYATICSWSVREKKPAAEKNYDLPEGKGFG